MDMQAVAFVPEMSHFHAQMGRIFVDQLPDKVTKDANPPLNGPIHIISTIMHNIMASAAKAEVSAAYISD
jgi:hypothetical protein